MRRRIFSIVSVSSRWPCTWAQPVMPGLTLWRRDNGEIRSANASLRAIGCGRGPTIDISPISTFTSSISFEPKPWHMLHRNLRNLYAYAGRGETAPLEEGPRYKFYSTEVTERWTLLAARIFKATGRRVC